VHNNQNHHKYSNISKIYLIFITKISTCLYQPGSYVRFYYQTYELQKDNNLKKKTLNQLRAMVIYLHCHSQVDQQLLTAIVSFCTVQVSDTRKTLNKHLDGQLQKNVVRQTQQYLESSSDK